jgi:DNA segregation ATPase FtsK/SpoIIIE, S-DNA-T family
MVRSESPPLKPPPAGGDGLVTLVEIAFKLTLTVILFKLRLVVWAVLFPMLSVPILLTSAAGETGGPTAATAVGLASLMILAGWRLRYPASFHRLISGRIWKRWRRWSTYRRPWAHLCAMHGLTVVLNNQVSVPKLRRVKVGYASDSVIVKMLYGQSIEDWQGVSTALAHAFGATSVRVRQLRPGWAAIDVHHTDALASVVALPNLPCCEGLGVEALTAGVTERGDRWQVRIRGHHVLVAGATGAGKGSVVWSVLAGLGPAIRAGIVHLWVIDPKGGMEFGPGQALYQRFEHDPGEGTVRLLRDAAAILTNRADRLRGVTRSHTPTVEEPLVLLVIDEIASLTAYSTDRKVRAEIEQLLGLILSQGRAVGVNVIAAVQDPSKDVLPFRQLFPTRIALRLTEPSQVAMVLGDSARDRGAHCDRIPDTLPGVGYVAEERSSELVRVRAFHVSDDDIARLCTTFRPVSQGDPSETDATKRVSAA